MTSDSKRHRRESVFKNQAERLLHYAAEFVRKAEEVLK
jgi:hypothetical protein